MRVSKKRLTRGLVLLFFVSVLSVAQAFACVQYNCITQPVCAAICAGQGESCYFAEPWPGCTLPHTGACFIGDDCF